VDGVVPWIRRVAESGLQLAIENSPQNTPEEFNELFDRLRSLKADSVARVGMCLDIGHANLCASTRNDFLRYVQRLDERVPIIHLHLHENRGDYDSHLPLFSGPAGQNPSGIRELIRQLRQRRYSGSMILEQWPEPRSLLNQARERLIQLLAEIP
jgi:sugar phosphate isomerase/epimerase